MTIALLSRPTAVMSSRVAARYAAIAAAALVCAHLHLRRPATLCLFRAVTGVPCPFCGGTTSTVALARGNIGAAFAASPIAPFMLVAFPWLGQLRLPQSLQGRSVRWTLVVMSLLAAEVWQLARFGLLHG